MTTEIAQVDSRAPQRAASSIVLVSIVVGLVAGSVWSRWAPTVAQVSADSSLGVSVDATFGVIAIVVGLATGGWAMWRYRQFGFASTLGVFFGALGGTAMMLAIGQLLGAPMVRALPVLLLWPIAALLIVVSVGLTVGLGTDSPAVVADDDLEA